MSANLLSTGPPLVQLLSANDPNHGIGVEERAKTRNLKHHAVICCHHMLSYAVMLTKTRAPKPGSRFIADRVQEHAEGWNSHQDNPYAIVCVSKCRTWPADTCYVEEAAWCSVHPSTCIDRKSKHRFPADGSCSSLCQPKPKHQKMWRVCARYLNVWFRLCWKAHLNTQLSLTSVHRITGDSSKATSPRILRVAGYRTCMDVSWPLNSPKSSKFVPTSTSCWEQAILSHWWAAKVPWRSFDCPGLWKTFDCQVPWTRTGWEVQDLGRQTAMDGNWGKGAKGGQRWRNHEGKIGKYCDPTRSSIFFISTSPVARTGLKKSNRHFCICYPIRPTWLSYFLTLGIFGVLHPRWPYMPFVVHQPPAMASCGKLWQVAMLPRVAGAWPAVAPHRPRLAACADWIRLDLSECTCTHGIRTQLLISYIPGCRAILYETQIGSGAQVIYRPINLKPKRTSECQMVCNIIQWTGCVRQWVGTRLLFYRNTIPCSRTKKSHPPHASIISHSPGHRCTCKICKLPCVGWCTLCRDW